LAVVSTRRSDTLISRAMVSMMRSPNSSVPFDDGERRPEPLRRRTVPTRAASSAGEKGFTT
jgi:hypothetical protein